MAEEPDGVVRPDRLIKSRELEQLTSMSYPTILRFVQEDPTFPRPIKISDGMTRWSENEVQEWLNKVKAKRNG